MASCLTKSDVSSISQALIHELQEPERIMSTGKWFAVGSLFLFGMWLRHFSGLGHAIVGGIGEQEESKYISNSTAQPSIRK